MIKEKPKPMLVRFYKSHRKFIGKLAKKHKESEAKIVRDIISIYMLSIENEDRKKKASKNSGFNLEAMAHGVVPTSE